MIAAEWLSANARVRAHPEAALSIARSYGRDWKTGRNTAVCAASANTPLWQEAVARCYPGAEARDSGSRAKRQDPEEGLGPKDGRAASEGGIAQGQVP